MHLKDYMVKSGRLFSKCSQKAKAVSIKKNG